MNSALARSCGALSAMAEPLLLRHWQDRVFDPAYPFVASTLRASQRPLLDLGCGVGLLACYLRANGHAAPILGLDVDEEKIAIAQAGAWRRESRISRRGCARFFRAIPGILSCSMCLHYFSDDDQQQLLKKIARASRLCRGGALIRPLLNEPNWRFAATKLEEWFVRFSGWIPQRREFSDAG